MLETPFTPTDPLLPEPLVESLQEWVEAQPGGAGVAGVSFAQHSNDVAELRLDDGRRMMVKRGRYDWAADRFDNSRAASAVLRHRVGLAVPEPLDVPDEMDDHPLEVYWRIELPTLSQVWPELDDHARTRALLSWGAMLRRMHSVQLAAWGPLRGGRRHETMDRYVGHDLYDRLIPAAWGEWRDAVPALEEHARHLPAVAERTRGREPAMAHGDVHMGNVLCRMDGRRPDCVGLLDLESAVALVPESDLAIAEVLHGPHFEQPIGGDWFEALLEGYGAAPDPLVMGFFRAYHLANLGFFSTLVGDAEHAALVLEALEQEVRNLDA